MLASNEWHKALSVGARQGSVWRSIASEFTVSDSFRPTEAKP